MAKKQQPTEPFDALATPAKPEAPVAAAVEPVDELTAAKDRIAELEKQLASKGPVAIQENSPNFVDGIAPDLNPTHKVSVKDATKNVLVHAPDQANAEARYRRKTGMVRTEHPYIVEAIA